MPSADAVDELVAHVFGVDLHPVAVTLARVTYLLGIGRERLADRRAFAVPVYLGDTVQWNQDETLLAAGGITVHTTDGAELFARQLHFPESVVADAASFDRLVAELAERAGARERGSRPLPPIAAILNRYRGRGERAAGGRDDLPAALRPPRRRSQPHLGLLRPQPCPTALVRAQTGSRSSSATLPGSPTGSFRPRSSEPSEPCPPSAACGRDRRWRPIRICRYCSSLARASSI